MTKCYFCGKELPQGTVYCSSCDHETLTEDPFTKPKSPSIAWYLLPIFLGIVGGVIAFFIIKNKDPKKAKYCLVIGVIAMAAGLTTNWLFQNGFLP